MSGIRVHNEKARQQLTGCLHVPLSKLGDDVVILLAPLFVIGLTHAKDMQRNNACSMPEKKKGFGITRNSIGTASFSLIAHTSTDCSAFPNPFLALKALRGAYSAPLSQ